MKARDNLRLNDKKANGNPLAFLLKIASITQFVMLAIWITFMILAFNDISKPS